MKSVSEPQDLEQFGIEPLTGESCAAGYRLLCDLTVFGRQVVADFLGLTEDGFRPNWNGGKTDDPAVASVMLAYELVTPLAAWGFGMKGADAIAILNSGEVWATFFDDGDTPEEWQRFLELHRAPSRPYGLRRTLVGKLIHQGRNRHAFSGRST